MNGYEIYKKALLRLGADDGDEITVSNTNFSHALESINQIAEDLHIKQISELSQELDCDIAACEAICCGVAMLLSLSYGEAQKNGIFTAVYNAKRAALLCKTLHIEDTLPVSEGGE